VAWEAPDGLSLAGIGSIGAVEGSGPRRFEEIRDSVRNSLGTDSPSPFALGGFAFSSGGTDGLRESLFFVPQRTFRSERGAPETIETRWTVPDRDRAAGAAGLTPPDSVVPASRDMSRERWIDLVRATLDRIRAGAFSKAVLARSVTVDLPRGRTGRDVFASLRLAYPGCHRFLIADGDGNAFLGASPEILVSESGVTRTEAVAGTLRCEPGDDAGELERRLLASAKDRSEHEAVLRHVRDTLEPWCSALEISETEVMRLPHLLHLRTRIAGRHDGRVHVLDSVARLHPTPAVAGWPRAEALEWIARVEPEDRGWYAGPVGWMDARGEGSFAVGIRSAMIRGGRARLFAGAGIVEGSDPELEWHETELKMRGMLDAITGA
jgi:menaquinone-specific isochorismate synthase